MRLSRALVTVVAALTLLAAAGAAPAAPADFSQVDAAMRARVRDDGLAGGALLIADTDGVLERTTFGTFRRDTVMPIASASKWLTAATLMTLVDEGRVKLDDPISKYLDGFDDQKRTVTIRQALSHTTGLSPQNCAGNPSVALATCEKQIAASVPFAAPGTAFRYTAVGFVLAARVVETVTGQSFEQAFKERVALPVGMKRTKFTRGGSNPDPAGSAVSTLDDYGSFVKMLAAGGLGAKGRVLSEASVAEIERDQMKGIDTRADGAVQVTRIPTYGLGVWRDVTGPNDEAQVVSGSGAFGFYPWIDRVHSTYGIVAVADLEHGSGHAVPSSQRIAQLAWTQAAASP